VDALDASWRLPVEISLAAVIEDWSETASGQDDDGALFMHFQVSGPFQLIVEART
jgi:hypothetical protein